ncbi:MAG: hypothetical protein AVDCRST_MAG12-2363, partial [uncultured Rubrobacteraceae bacterium]
GQLLRGRVGRRRPADVQVLHQPRLPGAGALSAVLLCGLRGWPDQGGGHTRLQLRGGVHRVPVRVGALAGRHDGRGLHGVLHRQRLRERLRPAAHARRVQPARDHPRLHHGLARAGLHDGDARNRAGARNGHAHNRRVRLFRPHSPRHPRQHSGHALRGRHRDDAAHPAGRAGDTDADLPRPLPGAGLRPAEPADRLDRDGRPPEPVYRDPRRRARLPGRRPAERRPGLRHKRRPDPGPLPLGRLRPPPGREGRI